MPLTFVLYLSMKDWLRNEQMLAAQSQELPFLLAACVTQSSLSRQSINKRQSFASQGCLASAWSMLGMARLATDIRLKLSPMQALGALRQWSSRSTSCFQLGRRRTASLASYTGYAACPIHFSHSWGHEIAVLALSGSCTKMASESCDCKTARYEKAEEEKSCSAAHK